MTANSTAYDITHYVSDAVMVSALAIDDCLDDPHDLPHCKNNLHIYIENKNFTIDTVCHTHTHTHTHTHRHTHTHIHTHLK